MLQPRFTFIILLLFFKNMMEDQNELLLKDLNDDPEFTESEQSSDSDDGGANQAPEE